MESTWNEVYPWIKTALLNLDSVDALLRQAVEKISATYEAECLLWAGLEMGRSETLRLYGTLTTVNNFWGDAARPLMNPACQDRVQPFMLQALPPWLRKRPLRLMQLETGELIVPINSRGHASEQPGGKAPDLPQFVLQLRRSRSRVLDSFPSLTQSALAQSADRLTINGWSGEELESLEMVCSHLGLAYSTLYWREKLEQSRQQVALIGRISRLLNSTLNPDEVVGRIVAELGYGLQCDRSILVDLRSDPVTVLAVWNYPERQLPPLKERRLPCHPWKTVIDLFMQGGASYLQMGQHDRSSNPLQTWMASMGVLSALLVPLFIQEEFFGAVVLLSYQQERAYLIDELQTIRQVADQAAIALTNAQNYQRLWHRQEALRIQNDSLQQKVMRDALTQLMNRRSLEREFEQLSAGTVWTVQPAFSLVVCDIDYFKTVNDMHGHLIGDEVLVELSQRLQGQLRRGTPAYRYGGEEFVIILLDTPLDQALDVAERLRHVVRTHPMSTQIGNLHITASFGVAQQSLSDRSAWDVLQRADRALYEAKRKGRDRVQTLDPLEQCP